MSDTRNPPAANTDREIWREREGDYYSPSIHVTANGGIGMNVGGYVIVKPVRQWHTMALRDRLEIEQIEDGRLRLSIWSDGGITDIIEGPLRFIFNSMLRFTDGSDTRLGVRTVRKARGEG